MWGSMRPQSASQYDPEEDDETVIVYNDTSCEQPWECSQFTISQSEDPSVAAANGTVQNEGESEARRPHDQQAAEAAAAAPKSNPRKRRYRSLGGRDRNFRRRKDHSIADLSMQHETSIGGDQVDDFASLRSKIERLSPEQQKGLSQEQNNNNIPLAEAGDEKNERKENSKLTIDSTRNIEVSATGAQKSSKSNSWSAEPILCSPPDFDFCTFDHNEDEDEIPTDKEKDGRKKTSKRSSNSSRLRNKNSKFSNDGKNEFQGDDDEDFGRDNSGRTDGHRRFSFSERPQFDAMQKKNSARRRSVEPKHLQMGTSSAKSHKRKRSATATIGRGPFASSQQPQSSQPQQSSTICENVKSIVGLRPTHWHRGTSKPHNRNTVSTERKPLRQLAKTSALMAATRFSFGKTPNRTLHKTKGDATRCVEKPRRGFGRAHRTRNCDRSVIEKSNENEIHSEKKKTDNSESTTSSFSFAPSFVPTKSSALSQDSIGDDSGDDCRVITTPINPSFAFTPPLQRRRRSKATTGEWVRRLVSLNNAQSNDLMRIQNKAFARHRILLDVNDPRKRAKTYTDVTILGQYIGPWINVPEDMKITVLGFVHCHTQQNNAPYTKDRYVNPHQQKEVNTKTVSKDFFAWFTFTLSTARRIELQKGCKLRIYNAIILPCRLPVVFDAPPSSILSPDNGIEIRGTVCCEKTVICTHLCERIDSRN